MRGLIRSIVAAAAAAAALLVPAAGQGAGAPALAWSPATNGAYDYGTITVGQTASQTFRLTNSGGSATRILTVALSGSSAFTKTADGCTATSLGPRKSCSVTVQYGPTTAGQSDSATLAASGKKPAASASLTLTGAGASRHVYWTNFDTNTIGRADLDGQNPNLSFITGAAGPEGVAVDSGHVYWADNISFTIGRADLDGQNPNQFFITGASGPGGVAVDSGHVYWANFGTNTIGRAGLDGQNPNQSFISGASVPAGVAVGAGHVYWTNFDTNTVGRADLDGQNPNQSFITGAYPNGVAAEAWG
jgi:virginiamycin B lyase